jgi:hypothetical protein
MDQERLTDKGKLEVRRIMKADDDIIGLLRSTVLGSEGGMRYTMLNTPERIATYGDGLSFLAYYKRNSLKGVIGLCRRTVASRRIRYAATYLRYLAVHSAFQVERAPGRRRDNHNVAGDSFKQKIITLIRDPLHSAGDISTDDRHEGGTANVASTDFYGSGGGSDGHASGRTAGIADGDTGRAVTATESGSASAGSAAGSAATVTGGGSSSAGSVGAPHVMYAYVESHNERSRNMINQAGYEYIRSFLTVAFSRFNPKPDPSVTRLKPEEEPAMAKLLGEYYSDYCFYTDEFSFHDHRYYVLRRNGEIVAGVGAIPAQYRVVNIPGVWGWIIMKILPGTPLFRRLFQPESFRYIILNAIYCRRGDEALLPDLFESVCAGEGFHTALTWLDDHSQLYETLRTNRRMGALNRMLNAKPGLVYALFSGMTQEETEKFYDSPAYISGFDFS